MAKKKHHGKKRRRVGGMSLNAGSMVVKAAAVAAGYLLADSINGAIDKANTTTTAATATTPATASQRVSTNIVMAGELGVGALLLLGKKSPGAMGLVKVAAGGLLAGAGLKRALKSFGVISGYQNTPVIAGRRMRGYQNTPVLAGASPVALSGMPSALGTGGFRVNGPGYVPVGSAQMGAVNPGAAANMPQGASGYMN